MATKNSRNTRPEHEPVSAKKKRTASQKKLSPKEKARKKRRKIILFIIEIVVLVIMVVALWGVLKVEKSGKVDIAEESIVINESVKEHAEKTMQGYKNIALFGVDSTTGALTKNTRSDSIMIASINLDTGECKIVSVYRDTFLNLTNDSYNKCNAAYAKGGPEQAMSMLNMNLDLNITDFVTVGFGGLTDTIDALGGVMISIEEEEISHLNNYQKTIAEDLKRSGYTPITDTGYQLVNGLQATAYCRIRYTAGDDFKRAERQREVLTAIADKAKTASPTALSQIATDVFSQVYTSLDLSEIISLLADIAKYEITETDGFPHASMRATGTISSKGSCVIPVDLESNVVWLHEFLFDTTDYEPSKELIKYSEAIRSETSPYIK